MGAHTYSQMHVQHSHHEPAYIWGSRRREKRLREAYPSGFMSQTFRGFDSHLYSRRSFGKSCQPASHVFWIFLLYVSCMRERSQPSSCHFFDQCFVKWWQLFMTMSQVTFAADHVTESDSWCLLIFFVHDTCRVCVCARTRACVFLSFKYN